MRKKKNRKRVSIMDNSRYLFRGKRLDNKEWEYGNYHMAVHYKTGRYTKAIQVRRCWGLEDVFIDPDTIGQCTGLYAAKSYRGESEEDRLVFDGDVLSCPILRLGGTYNNWQRKINKNHGKLYRIHMQVVWQRNPVQAPHGGWGLEKIPGVTDKQIAKIEEPVGKEYRKQSVNYHYIKIEECEIVGTVYDMEDAH